METEEERRAFFCEDIKGVVKMRALCKVDLELSDFESTDFYRIS